MNNCLYYIVILVLFVILFRKYILVERYSNYNNDYKGSNMCIKSLNCNTVPNFPRGLRPNQVVTSNCNDNFDGLTPEKGKYTFKIPEFKYDGIYSKEKCGWSLSCKKPNTYSTNKLFHTPSKCLFSKTIIDKNECSYDKFMYSRAMNLQENDIDNCYINSC